MSAADIARALPAHLDWPLRFVHPEKSTELARLSVGASDIKGVVAAALGLSAEDVRAQRALIDDQVRSSARLLLEDARVTAACRRLPFLPGQTIVALGDSITDDSLSWAYQLEAVLQQVYAVDAPSVVNAGRSGDTTADAIDRLDLVLAHEPDWVIQLLGTNDVRHHGDRRIFSTGQTGTNLDTIAHLLVDVGGVRLIRMTPPPVAADVVHAATAAPGIGLRWSQADLARIGRHLLRSDPAVVDLHTPLLPRAADLLDPDGLHPNVDGHREILRLLLLSLGAADSVGEMPA